MSFRPKSRRTTAWKADERSILFSCLLWHAGRNGIAQVQNATGIAVEQLLLVRRREIDLADELKRRCGIPARIVRAVHDIVDAIIVDSELDARRVGQHHSRLQKNSITEWATSGSASR